MDIRANAASGLPATARTACGDKKVIQATLRRNRRKFYTYVLRRPNDEPFYVGKGVDFRIFCHEVEADGDKKNYKLNLIRAVRSAGHELIYEIDMFHPDEVSALKRERELIDLIGRVDFGRGPLTNLTDGGEGPSNPSPISKEERRVTLGGVSGDGGERDTVNRYFLTLYPRAEDVDSIPIKPLSEFKPSKARPNKKPGTGPTLRQALALFASGVAHEAVFEPGARLPRRFNVGGVPAIIEGGVLSRMINSNFVTVEAGHLPDEEVLILTQRGFDELIKPYRYAVLRNASAAITTTESAKFTEPQIDDAAEN